MSCNARARSSMSALPVIHDPADGVYRGVRFEVRAGQLEIDRPPILRHGHAAPVPAIHAEQFANDAAATAAGVEAGDIVAVGRDVGSDDPATPITGKTQMPTSAWKKKRMQTANCKKKKESQPTDPRVTQSAILTQIT